jgi:hypothetical protein
MRLSPHLPHRLLGAWALSSGRPRKVRLIPLLLRTESQDYSRRVRVELLELQLLRNIMFLHRTALL